MHALASLTLFLALAGEPEGHRRPPIGGGSGGSCTRQTRLVPLAHTPLGSHPAITGAVGEPARALRQPQAQPRKLLQAAATAALGSAAASAAAGGAAARNATAQPRASSAAPAIASGVLAGEDSFPYIAMLMRSASSPFGCGGSLIARDRVITAARERARQAGRHQPGRAVAFVLHGPRQPLALPSCAGTHTPACPSTVPQTASSRARQRWCGWACATLTQTGRGRASSMRSAGSRCVRRAAAGLAAGRELRDAGARQGPASPQAQGARRKASDAALPSFPLPATPCALRRAWCVTHSTMPTRWRLTWQSSP